MLLATGYRKAQKSEVKIKSRTKTKKLWRVGGFGFGFRLGFGAFGAFGFGSVAYIYILAFGFWLLAICGHCGFVSCFANPGVKWALMHHGQNHHLP
jgi:hypothetical protein